MFAHTSELVRLGIGGLDGLGPGVAGFQSWIVAFGVLLVLSGLAWWTSSPAPDKARAKQRRKAR